MKIEFERTVTENAIEKDDGGQSLSLEFANDEPAEVFIRLMSWDETLKHESFRRMIGKNIKVTIESY
jgi:hypothetical protein